MTVRKKIPIGVDSFGELVDPAANYVFVDKSLFIKEIIDSSTIVTLITRPRGSGKTLNISMLEHFLAPEVIGIKTHGMFDQLAIGRVENGHYITTHQGQYPVIFVSFKDIKTTSLSLTIRSMCSIFQSLFRKHRLALLDSESFDEYDRKIFRHYLDGNLDQADIENALLILCELLHKHHGGKQVYLLIDEYDTPLNYAHTQQSRNEITALMQNMLSITLKGNPYLEKGVMTGILRISQDDILSSLNNVKIYSTLNNKYAEHFGFTDAEMSSILTQYNMTNESEAIRRYYKGYCIGNIILYNPWSIMKCLENNGILEPYWAHAANDCLLENSFVQAIPTIKEQLQQLIDDGESGVIETHILESTRFAGPTTSATTFWSVLVATGYLTPLHKEECEMHHYHCKLAIPNEDVRQRYINIMPLLGEYT